MSVRSSDVGRSISEIRLNLDVQDLEPVLHDVLETLGTRELEVQDREKHWHLLRIRPYRTSENRIEGVVLILHDIDDYRRSRQDLRNARDFAQAVIEWVLVPLVVLYPDFSIRSINGAFRTLTGLSRKDLEGRSFPELSEMLWGMEVRPLLESAQQQGPPATFEIEHKTEAPRNQALVVKGVALQTEGEQAILLVLEDVTLRWEVEGMLRREKQNLEGEVQYAARELGNTKGELQALAARLFTSQEEERRYVARELHDDITQKLAILEMNLERIQQNPPKVLDDLTVQLEPLREKTEELSEDVRRLSHRLHPAILDDLGLEYALKSLVEEFENREGMPATFTRRNMPESVPRDVAAALYRIAQEAIRNVAKHAGKTHVKVLLEGAEQGLRMEVKDSGQGFDPKSVHDGLGLISMIERARLVRGVVSIQSAVEKGTCVAVEVPITPTFSNTEVVQ
jgi:two-component system, chemotaxis family, CheB/CheR fusion protein